MKVVTYLFLGSSGRIGNERIKAYNEKYFYMLGEWPSGLHSLRQLTKVKLGRVRSDSRWVTSEV